MLGTFSESTQPMKCCVLNSIRSRLQLFFLFSFTNRSYSVCAFLSNDLYLFFDLDNS